MTAEINDDEETAEMIAALGKLFRHSYKPMKGTMTLENEFEHLKIYVQIINYRYHNKFKLKLEDMHSLRHYAMIPLLFQPILENTIVHGQTEGSEESINIDVSYEINGHILKFYFRDNGAGIPEERLAMLNKRLLTREVSNGEESTLGIGLLNVDERINLHYGPAYGLRVSSQLGEGTIVTVTLPFNE